MADDLDRVLRVIQDEPPTDIEGLAKLVGRAFVELHGQSVSLRRDMERGFNQINLRLVAVETRLAAIEVRLSDGEASPDPQQPTGSPE